MQGELALSSLGELALSSLGELALSSLVIRSTEQAGGIGGGVAAGAPWSVERGGEKMVLAVLTQVRAWRGEEVRDALQGSSARGDM